MEKYVTVIKNLENEEFENGKLKLEQYQQLLVAYLNTSQLMRAIWLGKRVILNSPKDGIDITQLLRLAISLQTVDYPDFFRQINYPWPEVIKSFMEDLKNKTRDEMLSSVGYAYSTIRENCLMDITLLPKEPLKEKCLALGWTYDLDGPKVIILPKAPPTPPKPIITSEEQLFKLTTIVSFLEN